MPHFTTAAWTGISGSRQCLLLVRWAGTFVCRLTTIWVERKFRVLPPTMIYTVLKVPVVTMQLPQLPLHYSTDSLTVWGNLRLLVNMENTVFCLVGMSGIIRGQWSQCQTGSSRLEWSLGEQLSSYFFTWGLENWRTTVILLHPTVERAK